MKKSQRKENCKPDTDSDLWATTCQPLAVGELITFQKREPRAVYEGEINYGIGTIASVTREKLLELSHAKENRNLRNLKRPTSRNA